MSSLRKARLSNCLSIVESAELIGIPAGYLSQIENGKRQVSSERASRIAAVYKVEKEEIFLPSRYAVREVLEEHEEVV